MSKVMIFTIHNTDKWWRYLGSQLKFASETVILSDLPHADICITPEFNRLLRTTDTAGVALEVLGNDACNEVIARDRILRTLDRTLALRMIGAMWQTLDQVIAAEAPDLFLHFCVDRYILDLLERILRRRGVRYVGLVVSPVPEHIMFMAKGEYTPVREPAEEEIERTAAMLAAPLFVPAYVANRSRFNFGRFLRTYLHFSIVRRGAFALLKRWEDNPLDWRYLGPASHERGYTVRLRDWKVMKYLQQDWKATLEATPFEKRVFFGLGVNPEAAIEYWCKHLELVDYQTVYCKAAEVLTRAGYRLFVKDHPSQFGFRQVEFFERLARHDGVVFVPYDVPAPQLIANTKATLTLTGTVGLQAALSGRCAIVESGAYYLAADGPFIALNSLADLDRLDAKLDAFRLPTDLPAVQRQLARHILRSSVPGWHTWQNFSASDPECVRKTAPLVESLNRYLPRFAVRDEASINSRGHRAAAVSLLA